MPSVGDLISSAISALPENPQAVELFEQYENRYHISDELQATGIEFPVPLTLLTFRGLQRNIKEQACRRLTNDYADIFQALIPLLGGKQGLLAAIDFQRFQAGEPDAAHQYIAYLYIEGRLQRVVSLNWDCLIEIAVQKARPGTNLNIVRDEPSWVEMNAGPQEILAKVHGCALQYPAQCGNIVISAADVGTATARPWIQMVLRDFLNGLVLFSGYRARDSTLNVPLSAIELLRQHNELPSADYYVAQEDPLEPLAQDVLAHGEASHHIRLNANDLFCSIYFGWLRARLREVVQSGRSRTRVERPFQWPDAQWNRAMDRVNRLIEDELSAMLDHIIGMPEGRVWGPQSLRLPIDLSLCRTLFAEGKVDARDRYGNLLFGDVTRDLVLLIMLSTLVDIVRGNASLNLTLEQSYCGVTLRDSRTRSFKQIILYRGTFAFRSEAVLRAYLEEVEAQQSVAPEVIVIPCDNYEVSPTGDDLAPGRVLQSEFQGDHVTIKNFIAPDRVLRSQDMDGLEVALRQELDIE
jgi:hypothetical protein